jgi:hypothetical protein
VSYATEHASAYADVLAAGAAVTITATTQAYNAATGRSTPSTSTLAGAAMAVESERRWLDGLIAAGLVQSSALVLMFVAATFGDLPSLGATLAWGGQTVTIRRVKPFDPDGQGTIFCYLAVER